MGTQGYTSGLEINLENLSIYFLFCTVNNYKFSYRLLKHIGYHASYYIYLLFLDDHLRDRKMHWTVCLFGKHLQV